MVFCSHWCLWVVYTVACTVFFEWWPAMFFVRSTYDLVFSQGIIGLDVFSTTRVMCFLEQTPPCIFRGRKVAWTCFLMRNFRECVFWWWNLSERVFLHVWIIWHYACHTPGGIIIRRFEVFDPIGGNWSAGHNGSEWVNKWGAEEWKFAQKG